jgi:hypothetical protein
MPSPSGRSSRRFGRLFPIRVRNQNTIVVNLPTPLPQGAEMLVTIVYAGKLDPETTVQEAVQAGQSSRGAFGEDVPDVSPEPSFLYSNRSLWYPQGSVTTYATARLRITVPATYDCVASGDLAIGWRAPADAAVDPAPARTAYLFVATQPVRYLAFVISRFVRSDAVTLALPQPAQPPDGDSPLWGASSDALKLAVAASPRQGPQSKPILDRAADIARYYASLIGDCPYPSFTIALVEARLPGGHSPAYFAQLNQPLPTSRYVWRNDPAAFENYPEFFLAHELAHQWWGQAIGWRNYHEQWLSEGFAQYFAALYAEHHRGHDVFSTMMRQVRRWALEDDDQGPIYLGYRLGHIKNDARVFRALVYDKGAAVLHMLRRLVGDEAFFRGLRRFYRVSRLRKVGTDDFRIAMEHETGRSLERFFEQWVYSTKIPRLRFTYHVESGATGDDILLHVDQLGDIFDVPVPVIVEYADRAPVGVTVLVTERSVDMRVPLTGRLRRVEVRDDDGMLAEISK